MNGAEQKIWGQTTDKTIVKPGGWSETTKQGRNRKIFLRGQRQFSWYFPGRKFPFWYTQNKFYRLKSEKQKKKKKKKKKVPSSLLWNFSQLPFFHFQFSFFSSPLHFFPSHLFPVGQQKFPGQKSLGALCPLPPACYATATKLKWA